MSKSVKTARPAGEKPEAGSTNFSPASTLMLFVIFVICYLVVINIVAKIGLPQLLVHTLVVILPVAVFLGAGFSLRVSGPGGLAGFNRFQHADGLFGALHNAMAGASEWMSLFLLVGLISAFANTNHDGLAMVFGVFCGLALASIFILPKLTAEKAASPARTIASMIQPVSTQFARVRKTLRLTLAVVVITCAFLFLTAQIGAGTQVLKFHFPLSDFWAASCILVPVMLAIMTGGMRSATLANMLLYCLIGAAVILPAIWLSQSIAGNPVPQLSYAAGALQPILLLEGQLAESITGNAKLIFNQGNFDVVSGIGDFTGTFLVMMAGSAALPLLSTRVAGLTGSAERTRSLGWTLVLLALILSFIPPFVTFMKFEIYRDLVGLPIVQLGEGVGWLFNWAALEGGHHALVCGKPATNIDAMIAACEGGANHVLLPSDLQFSPLMTFLGAGEIADMPQVFSAIAYTGVLSAAATTIAIALVVIINTIDNELIPATYKSTALPIAQRLFISRLALIVLCIAGTWLAQNVSVPVTDFTLWGFALSAGALFPVMVLSIWWPGTTVYGAFTGLVSGIIVTSFLLLTIEYGPDWVARNGDEAIWNYPVIGGTLTSWNAALPGMLISAIVIVLVSLTESAAGKYRARSGK